jgi:hypothetical protein
VGDTSFQIRPGKKERKFQQVVWLDLETYSWILELSRQYDQAPNVVIADILKQLHEKGFEPSRSVVKTEAVKAETVEVLMCPICWGRFRDMANLRKHLEAEHPEAAKLWKW